jgi:hypothetical protein
MAAKLLRRIGLDGNPLRRPVDRVEAWTALALLVATLVAAPVLGWTVWRTEYAAGLRAEHPGPARFPTRAVLLADASYLPAAAELNPQVATPASWTEPNGGRRTGVVVVRAGLAAGTAVPLWTDATGEPVDAPQRHSQTVADALAAGALAGGGPVLLVTCVLLALRHILDRHRMARWDDRWRTVEPRWSGRRP